MRYTGPIRFTISSVSVARSKDRRNGETAIANCSSLCCAARVYIWIPAVGARESTRLYNGPPGEAYEESGRPYLMIVATQAEISSMLDEKWAHGRSYTQWRTRFNTGEDSGTRIIGTFVGFAERE